MAFFRTIGHAFSTAGCAVASGVTLGQVDALNKAVVDQANKCAHNAETVGSDVVDTTLTVAHGVSTASCAVAAGVCMGQVDDLNNAVKHQAGQFVRRGKAPLRVLDDVSSGVPVVGHVRGVVHYCTGDQAGGDRCMKGATHSTAAIAGGVGGFFVGGPVGAVAGSVAAGQACEGAITGVESAIHGEFRPNGAIANMVDAGIKGKDIDTALIDGVTEIGLDAFGGRCAAKGLKAAKVRNVRAPAKVGGKLVPIPENGRLLAPGERAGLCGQQLRAVGVVAAGECTPGTEDFLAAIDSDSDSD